MLKHLSRKHDATRCKKGTADVIGGEQGSCIPWVGEGDVDEDALEDDEVGGDEDDDADEADDPVD